MICPTCKGGRTLLKKVRGKGCYEVVLDVRDRIPYAVRDMSDVCGKYEAKPQAETWVPM